MGGPHAQADANAREQAAFPWFLSAARAGNADALLHVSQRLNPSQRMRMWRSPRRARWKRLHGSATLWRFASLCLPSAMPPLEAGASRFGPASYLLACWHASGVFAATMGVTHCDAASARCLGQAWQQSPHVKYLLAMRMIKGTHGMHGDETNVRHGLRLLEQAAAVLGPEEQQQAAAHRALFGPDYGHRGVPE
jgi:hypothetical protein